MDDELFTMLSDLQHSVDRLARAGEKLSATWDSIDRSLYVLSYAAAASVGACEVDDALAQRHATLRAMARRN